MTAISVPITPVAAAARGPATNLATAAQAVTIAAAARRTAAGEGPWDGELRSTMMPTAAIATIRTRDPDHRHERLVAGEAHSDEDDAHDCRQQGRKP
jgi:hypothetical protein